MELKQEDTLINMGSRDYFLEKSLMNIVFLFGGWVENLFMVFLFGGWVQNLFMKVCRKLCDFYFYRVKNLSTDLYLYRSRYLFPGFSRIYFDGLWQFEDLHIHIMDLVSLFYKTCWAVCWLLILVYVNYIKDFFAICYSFFCRADPWICLLMSILLKRGC